VHDVLHARFGEVLVAAHVVEVQVRVDEHRHVRYREAGELDLGRNRLRRRERGKR
jgi:hypothetical protein